MAPTEPRRQEASGIGWQEKFVDGARAPRTASVAMALADSLSYIVIPDFCTVSENKALQTSARKLQDIYLRQGDGDETLFRGIQVKWVTECSRYSVKELLDEPANAASDALLQRLLALLEFGHDPVLGDAALSMVAEHVFGTHTDLQTKTAQWYNEMSYDKVSNPEPMVNIYEQGGYFKRHGDGQHLTMLVVLENAEQGGGTAFYTDNDTTDIATEDDNPLHCTKPPERVERPPVNTAMIWGGNLVHSAMPVSKGSRTVFVGSFDLVDEHEVQEAAETTQ